MCQQARCIDVLHLRRRIAENTVRTVVSRDDRRRMEADREDYILATLHTVVSQLDRRRSKADREDDNSSIITLETGEVRSEYAVSSLVHTEMTREGVPRDELITICSRLGISIDAAQELLATMEQQGLIEVCLSQQGTNDGTVHNYGMSETLESETSWQVRVERPEEPRALQFKIHCAGLGNLFSSGGSLPF